MTTAEMNRRLATLTQDDVTEISRMIGEGYGETGIVNNAPYTRKQVNAVFQLYYAQRRVGA